MNGDSGSFQTVTRVAKTTLRIDRHQLQPEVIPEQAPLVPLRTIDLVEEPETLVYRRLPKPTDAAASEWEREIPMFEGTLVLPASPPPQSESSIVKPAAPAPPDYAALTAGGTLVMRPSAPPPPEATLILSPAAPPEARVGLATTANGPWQYEETRINPIEAWPGTPIEPNGLSGHSSTNPALTGPPAPGSRLSDKWRALSRVNRASIVLAPFALLMVAASLWLKPRPAEDQTANNQPAGEVESGPKVEKAKSIPAPAAPAGQTPDKPTLPANGKTLSRAAADAVSEGNTAVALRLYRQLAAAHPDVPAYGAAVRILEERTKTE